MQLDHSCFDKECKEFQLLELLWRNFITRAAVVILLCWFHNLVTLWNLDSYFFC